MMNHLLCGECGVPVLTSTWSSQLGDYEYSHPCTIGTVARGLARGTRLKAILPNYS